MKKKLILIVILVIIIVLGIGAFIFYNSKVELAGTSWKLADWSLYENLSDKADITLNLDDNELNGNGGVNNYSASYSTDFFNKITIENMSATEMASLENSVNNTEQSYFDLLVQVKYCSLENDVLKLLDENKGDLLIFNLN